MFGTAMRVTFEGGIMQVSPPRRDSFAADCRFAHYVFRSFCTAFNRPFPSDDEHEDRCDSRFEISDDSDIEDV